MVASLLKYAPVVSLMRSGGDHSATLPTAADNFVTAYGHARRALVREGQHVRTGEALAELGPRADGRPRLLFQVRRGAEAVDPTPLLGR